MLLAVCVVERPVVLAPLALRAPGTLNAGRGAKPPRAAEGPTAASLPYRSSASRALGSRRSQSARAASQARCWFESCKRAHAPRQPLRVRRDTVGGCHAACAFSGMTRTNNKPSSQSRGKQRAALLAERAGACEARRAEVRSQEKGSSIGETQMANAECTVTSGGRHEQLVTGFDLCPCGEHQVVHRQTAAVLAR
jgi:hypothetical protein